MEIYVSAFPTANGKWQVSSAGGQEPRWRQDGRELFYLSAEGKLMAVAVTSGGQLRSRPPDCSVSDSPAATGFRAGLLLLRCQWRRQRFLIATRVDEANSAPLTVLLNWTSAMEK